MGTLFTRKVEPSKEIITKNVELMKPQSSDNTARDGWKFDCGMVVLAASSCYFFGDRTWSGFGKSLFGTGIAVNALFASAFYFVVKGPIMHKVGEFSSTVPTGLYSSFDDYLHNHLNKKKRGIIRAQKRKFENYTVNQTLNWNDMPRVACLLIAHLIRQYPSFWGTSMIFWIYIYEYICSKENKTVWRCEKNIVRAVQTYALKLETTKGYKVLDDMWLIQDARKQMWQRLLAHHIEVAISLKCDMCQLGRHKTLWREKKQRFRSMLLKDAMNMLAQKSINRKKG